MWMAICTSVIVRTSVSWLMKMEHLLVCMCVFWMCRSNFSVVFQVISIQKFGIWCYVEKWHDIAHESWGVVWNFVDIAEALLPQSEDPKIHLPSKINVHHPRISTQDNGMWIYNTMLVPYSVYALETEVFEHSYHLSFLPSVVNPFIVLMYKFSNSACC